VPVLRAAPPIERRAGAAEDSADRTLFLFVDWFHVKKGELAVTLDPGRVTAEGRKLIDTYAREHGKLFEEGAHGFKPVDIPSGVRITREVAKRSEPWLLSDKPWEKGVGGATVLHDGDLYRCWYSARLSKARTEVTVDQGRVMELSGSALAYAESRDGWDWTKPALRVLPTKDAPENNLVSPYGHGGSVFRDDHGPPAERYKAFHFDELPEVEVPAGAPAAKRYGLFGITSPDGLRWAKDPRPLVRYFSDTHNVAAWDPLLGKYVGFFRHHLSGRTISRAETGDFWDWPDPQPLLYGGPLDAPADDYYTNGYTCYPGDPSLRLLFPAIYHRDRDSVDVRLAVSRDGRAFQWVSYDPVITLGADGEWDGGSLYANPDLVQLPDGGLALPFDGHEATHNEVFFHGFYGTGPGKTGAGWALWEDGRLAGIQADQLGQFTTNAARFDGQSIRLNARTTRAGTVEVELREKGKPLEGYTFADAVPFSGDGVWPPCRWKGRDDLSPLRGKRLELGFRLRSAKVFGYRFG
jgi:hypothetical protein